MQIYLGIDDTDIKGAPIGTGRLARMLVPKLPRELELVGVLRHQLLVADGIPYTSQNSSACLLLEAPDDMGREDLNPLWETAVEHVLDLCSVGSDPGVCLATSRDALETMAEFGKACTTTPKTQKEAMEISSKVSLVGLGGTNDGIIGATAAVGLTVHGWCGRYILYGRLREFGPEVQVADLMGEGVRVLSVDRNATVPAPGDTVQTKGWLRPQRWSLGAVLPVRSAGEGVWETLHTKNRKPEASAGQ